MKKPPTKQRQTLHLRIPDGDRAVLEAFAAKSGRTVTGEAVMRLRYAIQNVGPIAQIITAEIQTDARDGKSV